VLWQYIPGNSLVAIPAWGLYELAQYYGRRQTVIAAIALPPLVLATILPFEDDLRWIASLTFTNLVICELALALGYMRWTQRQAMEREVASAGALSEARLGEERLRIAREVHDVVAHAMVAINVQAGVAAHLLDQDTEQAREALLHIKRTSGEALTDLRATLGVLRDPDQAAPVGPAAGLEDLDAVAGQLRAAGIEVTVDVEGVEWVPTPVGSASYRIVQEALTNVLRHARASHASVVVRASGETVTIVVTDDGKGPTAPGNGAGAGVRGMRERATALGGVLSAAPAVGGGWRVEAALPLSRTAS
jgi:signal transduction histidine kinase